MRTWLSFGFALACTVGIAAAFLTWGTFRVTGFDGQATSLTLHAWNGNLQLLGFTVPNWVALVSLAIAGGTYGLRQIEVWEAHRALTVTAAAYCAFHAGFYVFVLGAQGTQARIGLGTFAMLLAGVALLTLSILERWIDAEDIRCRAVRNASRPTWGPKAVRPDLDAVQPPLSREDYTDAPFGR